MVQEYFCSVKTLVVCSYISLTAGDMDRNINVCVRERDCVCESLASEAKVLSLKSPNFFSTPLKKVHSSHTFRGCLNEAVEEKSNPAHTNFSFWFLCFNVHICSLQTELKWKTNAFEPYRKWNLIFWAHFEIVEGLKIWMVFFVVFRLKEIKSNFVDIN
jgi:hypothetical protein